MVILYQPGCCVEMIPTRGLRGGAWTANIGDSERIVNARVAAPDEHPPMGQCPWKRENINSKHAIGALPPNVADRPRKIPERKASKV